MESLALLLIGLALITGLVQISFYEKSTAIILPALFSGILLYLLYPLAIEQNNGMLGRFISGRNTPGNIAAILIVESLTMMAVHWSQLHNLLGNEPRYRRVTRLLLRAGTYCPGIFFFPALFYIQVQVFLANVYAGFSIVALGISIAAFCCILFAAFSLKKAIPDTITRIEIIYLLRTITILLAAVFSARPSMQDPVESTMVFKWQPALFLLILIALFTAAGFIIYQIKHRRTK